MDTGRPPSMYDAVYPFPYWKEWPPVEDPAPHHNRHSRRAAKKKLRQWQNRKRTKTMRTLKIELRMDFDDPERIKTVEEAAKVAAKHLYTTALLIADNKRKPQIALYGGDFFTPEEEIILAEELEQGDGGDGTT